MEKIVLRMLRRFGLFIGCFFVFFLAGCVMSDNEAITDIKLINESSNDLSISFEINSSYSPNDGYAGISVRKNTSFSFSIRTGDGGKSPPARNPNKEVVKIVFSNSDTGEVIKELGNNKKVFKFLFSEELHDWYELKITDELLQ
jgi:hypothetical protein